MDQSRTRRTFLQAAAAIGTSRFPIRGASDRVNLAVIGIGGRGRNHIDEFSTLPECQVAGVCDVNQAARERAAAQVQKLRGAQPKTYSDLRKAYEDKDIDAVSIATPNHWHALAAIWACQAGKDVYVEKPASHNIFEGRQMVAAARKYNRMVQVGSQGRTVQHKQRAMKLLREGAVGQVYMARGLCYRLRKSIGHTPDEPAPPGVDWDTFLGPAPMKPYSKNKFAYNWHWFWDTGNGDIGNQGVHEMDQNLWGINRYKLPRYVSSMGGKYVWRDDQETPNTQQAEFDFGDAEVVFDVRNMTSPPEGSSPLTGSNYTGNIFFGSEGYMVVDPEGFRLYKGDKRELALEEKVAEKTQWATAPHMRNFLEAVRARDHKRLNADIEIGAAAAAFCHLANISYRLKRRLEIDPATEKFIGDDEANAMLTRPYRAPFVVPEKV
ncbi:MAG: Gfo/Idh/MocA family oxidoreductase [Bryobacteraceae bacterium]|nr:Gfo/Idh/MocA family oxidoreductase [Bryobacteraceae bacterium]